MRRFLAGLTGWVLVFYYSLGQAATPLSQSADNVIAPVNFISTSILKISIVLGIGFLAASFMQYRLYKQSPTAVPFSRCIWMLILGLLLIGIPLAGKYAYLINQTIINQATPS